MSITDGVLNPLDDPKFKGKKRTSPVSPIAFAKYYVQVRALSMRLS